MEQEDLDSIPVILFGYKAFEKKTENLLIQADIEKITLAALLGVIANFT